jgi:hypothetical protein
MGMACSTYGKNWNGYMILVENQKERRHKEELDVDGRNKAMWSGYTLSRVGTTGERERDSICNKGGGRAGWGKVNGT